MNSTLEPTSRAGPPPSIFNSPTGCKGRQLRSSERRRQHTEAPAAVNADSNLRAFLLRLISLRGSFHTHAPGHGPCPVSAVAAGLRGWRGARRPSLSLWSCVSVMAVIASPAPPLWRQTVLPSTAGRSACPVMLVIDGISGRRLALGFGLGPLRGSFRPSRLGSDPQSGPHCSGHPSRVVRK